MRNSIILFASILLFASCSGGSEETTPATDTTKTDTVVAATIDYNVEWEAFKTTIVEIDTVGFTSFVGADVSDPASLLNMLREDWVWAELSIADYADLTVSDYNGTPVKEFSVGVEGQDEEGNVYESGIYLYFEETPTALVLVNVLMAG